MRPEDLATVHYIDGSQRLLLAAINELTQKVQELANRPADDYLSIQEVAKQTYSSVSTVTNWIKVGKVGPDGKLVKLPTFRFGEHDRVKRADLEEFGKLHELVGTSGQKSGKSGRSDNAAGSAVMRVA